mmetsp:Transcript_1260/g.1117  ORF Transcript_1260/g.1117 Transcript_1260/m.1117 type:complete len:82 (-) Transcript_1260:10-255(-)
METLSVGALTMDVPCEEWRDDREPCLMHDDGLSTLLDDGPKANPSTLTSETHRGLAQYDQTRQPVQRISCELPAQFSNSSR